MSRKQTNKAVTSEYNRQAYIRRKKRNADTAAGILTLRQIRRREYIAEGRTSPRKAQERLVDREKLQPEYRSVIEFKDTAEDRAWYKDFLRRAAS